MYEKKLEKRQKSVIFYFDTTCAYPALTYSSTAGLFLHKEESVKSLFAVIFMLFLVAILSPVQADTVKQVKYVDLDGDGFDDNATDNDLDGIPDKFASQGSKASAPRAMVDMNKMFQAPTTVLTASLGKSNHLLYLARNTAVLSLATCRGGLGRFDRFGGSATTQGNSGSGCAGGVCR